MFYIQLQNLFNMRLLLTAALLVGSLHISAQKTPEPYGPVPTKQQMEWQKMQYYMFIHFGPNTFTDKEWGHGDEDPKVFNPTELDARQWARTAKLAGMKGIIITAKHHDGFCLWPSKYSTHTVRESAWKDGKGDVLRELSDACKEYGIKFGVYLSPWDRNHPSYGTPEYNEIYANTIKEVLTGYGPIFEHWFDGANGEGPNGKKQEYNWPLFHQTVRSLQPDAIMFSDIGPDCRWVGNENGFAGETNWSTLNIKGFTPGAGAPSQKILNEGNENGEAWIPAECDVSIRPGWFFSPSTNDKVKSVKDLMEIYYKSIGRNGNLLLNVPVDRRGRIHENDSLRLMEFRDAIHADFARNLALNKKVSASGRAKNLTDGNFNTYWIPSENENSFTVELGQPVELNAILLQEYIPLGQRVKKFTISYKDGNDYKTIASGTTIGFKRILRFDPVKASSIKVTIEESNARPILSSVELYRTVQ
jgi:alpha-L-fucosidase